MKESQVVSLLADLCAAYAAANPHGAGNMSEDTRRRYVELLFDLDYEETKDAIDFLCKNNRHIAVPAEIRECVMARRTMLEEPEIAWGQVELAIRKNGRNKRPCFFNPATEAAVTFLNWRVLCDSDVSTMMGHRAHFFRIYETCAKRIRWAVETGEIRPGTAGAREAALRATGAPVDEPRAVIVDHGEDPLLPPGVSEMRTHTGKVLARIEVKGEG